MLCIAAAANPLILLTNHCCLGNQMLPCSIGWGKKSRAERETRSGAPVRICGRVVMYVHNPPVRYVWNAARRVAAGE